MDDLKLKLSTLPLDPGWYLLKDARGTIIYVGKAKKLKARVNSYFTGAHDFKTTKLVSKIVDFDYIVTHSEKEALILEINLIKKYRPRYNIMFMDDKSYPYLKLTKEAYPRLKVVRDKTRDKKADYFGPYPDASAAHTMRRLINHLYPLRKCETLPKKVCLYYHLGQCLGPCEFKLEETAYPNMVAEISKVLKGDDKALRQRLTSAMHEATEAMNYERAAEFRDDLKALDYVLDKQAVASDSKVDRDVFAYASQNGVIAIVGLMLRSGKILDRKTSTHILIEDEEESFINYVAQVYSDHDKPEELILPPNIDVTLLQESLDLRIFQPLKGQKHQLLELALTNAVNVLTHQAEIFARKAEAHDLALEQLQTKLNLIDIDVIELVDNSHLQGQFASSAVVVFRQGQASKQDYRLYNVSAGANDVANMEEVLYRRFLRKLKEKVDMPDLLLVDGGILQVLAAKRVLDALKLNVPVFGLVKDSKHNTSSLMNVEGEVIEIKDQKELFFLLTRMQDEVHRFVISHHQKRRSKALTQSVLDTIEGLGPKRKALLLKRFKSLKGIKEASDEERLEILPNAVNLALKEALELE